MPSICSVYQDAAEKLLSERCSDGFWEGELSASALSTATSVSALSLVDRTEHENLIRGGIRWLAKHQNDDGGWGDTVRSISNISTALLVRAAFHLSGKAESHQEILDKLEGYITRAGGLDAMVARYGKDKTFSVPIFTNCALAGQAEWKDITPLPFELSCLPHRWFYALNLPVVSYALPALIAIGQARYFHQPPLNPFSRIIRKLAVGKSLRVLESIQPSSGGFLEAVPLTSFVTMCLASLRRGDHPVARKGVEFLEGVVRPDGSWPIDSNLSVWVTTLSINALSAGGQEWFSNKEKEGLRTWLIEQQFRERHPYTNAAPGGWGWTHLPGSVPDADDTPGTLLALKNLGVTDESSAAARLGIEWLLSLQNRDGGWPTFCRGWGHLPFDRSGTDLTAHVLRAFDAWRSILPDLSDRIDSASASGLEYLERSQNRTGYWLPLWFGNQFAPNDENRTYGTARVLAAYHDLGRHDSHAAVNARQWLLKTQNDDGGWGGAEGTPSSIEETAQAVDALFPLNTHSGAAVKNASRWLADAIEDGRLDSPAPIGFYFAKLWYFEKLYPLIYAAAALGRVAEDEPDVLEAASVSTNTVASPL